VLVTGCSIQYISIQMAMHIRPCINLMPSPLLSSWSIMFWPSRDSPHPSSLTVDSDILRKFRITQSLRASPVALAPAPHAVQCK
jgi:hypothetical protein